jgi:hypothetical protein
MDDDTLYRFESKIDKTDDCWLWMSSKDSYGYGTFSIKNYPHLAHRLTYMIYNGTIPDGMVVRHKCRNKCVNPEHLEIGTHAENNQDMIRDGTSTRGERSASAKLTADQVLEIRRRSAESRSELAKEFGLHYMYIGQIIRSERWKHI